ncbi:uncharacterized protein LOC110976349 [Acanthaster planci]|uniref:Uncharacterized protein LOC110976349 n=1 Tax=Acanthaster planci TaxID=133434 RepID=A0A8B7XZP3_ACAPL|nr:uncharacterized protein LOC110976349 [Acanthaster planci]
MNRFILLLLLGAFVAAIFGDGPKLSESTAIDSDIEAKGDFSVADNGPKLWVCQGNVTNTLKNVCTHTGRPHSDTRDDVQEENNPEFLDEADANFFLRQQNSKQISEECCHEGCYWEEVLEYC